MAKFVKGSYRTISEVNAVLEELQREGYPTSSITLVTNRDEIMDELEQSTEISIKSAEHQSGEQSLWERIGALFPVFTSSSFSGQEGPAEPGTEEESLLAGYQEELRQGEVLVVVDDILNQEASFHLDKLDSETLKEKDKTFDSPESKKTLKETPETDSHPDVESTEDVLTQETTYVPTDADTEDK